MSAPPASANPYRAPEALVAVDPARDALRKRLVRAVYWLAASAAALIAMVFLGTTGWGGALTLACIVVTLVAAVATVQSARALAAIVRSPRPGAWLVVGGVAAALAGIGMSGLGALAAFVSTVSFSRGRQLRSAGRVLLPPLAPGGAWAAPAARVAVDDAARDGVAARWRENARTEHASVGAFARLTLDLMALGAPPSLIAGAQRDALDEIAHAEACFALARAIDGRDVGPGAFPQAARARTLPRTRTLALAALAVDSLVDGALHEGVSARAVAVLARRCDEPAIGAMLRRIAADEGRHAAHGWDVVKWCLAAGGAPVASALRGAVRALPATMRTPLPDDAASGAWERWGIVSHALEAEHYAAARAHVAARVHALVAAAAAPETRAAA